MLPIILYSQSENKTEKYLQQFITDHKIKPSHIFKCIPEKNELSMDEARGILKMFFIQYPAERVFIFYRFGSTSWEVQNMLEIAWLMTSGALARAETRGVHYRTDYPQLLPEWQVHLDYIFGATEPLLTPVN